MFWQQKEYFVLLQNLLTIHSGDCRDFILRYCLQNQDLVIFIIHLNDRTTTIRIGFVRVFGLSIRLNTSHFKTVPSSLALLNYQSFPLSFSIFTIDSKQTNSFKYCFTYGILQYFRPNHPQVQAIVAITTQLVKTARFLYEDCLK